jgi:serine/threonine-protein kinase
LALLEGSVRRQQNRVRVSAQLVSAKDGYHLWSETYDRELSDIFAIQDDLARSIAMALRVTLVPAPIVERLTGDLDAYDLWLQGRCLTARLSPETVIIARRCFERAIACDPNFPLPYLAIAELLFEAAQYLMLPSGEARCVRPNVLKALSLNNRLGEAYALLGTVEGVMEYDWNAAERAFERAFELSPGSSTVLWRHAWYFLVPHLRIAEAVKEMHHAVALDPLSPMMHSFLGLTLITARDYAEAEKACRAAVELGPGLFWPHWFLATALIFRGAGEEALVEARVAAGLYGGPEVSTGMCAVYGLLGRIDEARQCFAHVMDLARTTPIQALGMAWAHLGVGDDRVFDWLDKAIEARDPSVTHMPSMPLYDGIRGDPRFRAMLAKMRLA